MVRLAVQRSDVIVVPSDAMAARVGRLLPRLRGRVVTRHHPVSADSLPQLPREPAVLCPVLFASYKGLIERLTELLAALDEHGDPAIRLRITADEQEVPAGLAGHPRVELLGRRSYAELRSLQARSKAIFFPTGLESFGYPLAEARASGQPVIARETAQNREIAGPALCGFDVGDGETLRHAVKLALTCKIEPDPGPFDPDGYFSWLLGPPR